MTAKWPGPVAQSPSCVEPPDRSHRKTQDIVAAVAELFRSVGLEATVESLVNNPGDLLGGVAASAASYNTSGAVEGEWSVFIADGSGAVVLHFNPAMIGTQIEDLLGVDTSGIDEDGSWLTSESMRIWAVRVDGWVLGQSAISRPV